VEQVASEFLRALRGRRSQVQLARRLGYRGNPMTDWERGERFPTAEEALRVAALSGVDVSAALARFAPTVRLRPTRAGFSLSMWLNDMRGDTPLKELAERVHASRFSVSRWLSGKAKPRLPDFFRLVDALTGRLPEWVAAFVDIEAVPSLLPRFRAVNAAKHLAFEQPWTEAVLRLLETEDYRRLRRHEPEFLAQRLGITPSEVETCLSRLQVADIVQRRGRRYLVKNQGAVDTQGGKHLLHALKRHWSLVAASRLTAPQASDYFAYNVISVSREDLERIQAKLRATFREIRTLVAGSRPEQVAALLNLQVVTFTPLGGATD
jgi:transcriptional regulator with XRE-family HTH domain